jgi:hypothetical protein
MYDTSRVKKFRFFNLTGLLSPEWRLCYIYYIKKTGFIKNGLKINGLMTLPGLRSKKIGRGSNSHLPCHVQCIGRCMVSADSHRLSHRSTAIGPA